MGEGGNEKVENSREGIDTAVMGSHKNQLESSRGMPQDATTASGAVLMVCNALITDVLPSTLGV